MNALKIVSRQRRPSSRPLIHNLFTRAAHKDVNMIDAPYTLQSSPIPKPHHLVFPAAAFRVDPVREGPLDESLDLVPRIRHQVPYCDILCESCLQPDDDVGYLGCHAVGPVVVQDFVVAGVGEWSGVFDVEDRPFVGGRGG